MLHHVVRNVLRDGDLSDPWGNTLSTHFALRDVLEYNGFAKLIPSSWQYSELPCGVEGPSSDDWGTQELHACFSRGIVNLHDLLSSGDVLNRYENLLVKTGKSY